MKTVKVLGSGCKNCVATARLIEEKAKTLGVAVEIEKVTDIAGIMSYGVMRTPSVVLDETVVHAGGVPRPEAVEKWRAMIESCGWERREGGVSWGC